MVLVCKIGLAATRATKVIWALSIIAPPATRDENLSTHGVEEGNLTTNLLLGFQVLEYCFSKVLSPLIFGIWRQEIEAMRACLIAHICQSHWSEHTFLAKSCFSPFYEKLEVACNLQKHAAM